MTAGCANKQPFAHDMLTLSSELARKNKVLKQFIVLWKLRARLFLGDDQLLPVASAGCLATNQRQEIVWHIKASINKQRI